MTFRYECQSCGEAFDFHHHPRDEEAYCSECGSLHVEKQFAPKCSHILKGEGWARDNYQTKKIK